jgi:hypothetical protein
LAGNASLFLKVVLRMIKGGIDISVFAKIFDTDIIAQVGLTIDFGA